MAKEIATVFRENDLVFIPDKEYCFIPAKVLQEFSAGDEGVVSLIEQGNAKKTLAKQETLVVERMDAQSYKDIPDMINLKMLNQASLMHNLRLRYEKEPKMDIYTNIGAILVAINPFVDLGLYSSEMEQKYLTSGTQLQDMPPHIFKVAEAALINLSNEDNDQSCVITGESGAGKTETTKRFLQYVSEKSKRNREAYGGDFGVDTEKLRQQILDSNPFMEAFGNAKTLRNDNSSRFGKLIDMQFEPSKGVVVGCSITNYLLEKSRVVKVSKGERNYHIFYQLCSASTSTHASEMKKKYFLQSADQFNYTLGGNEDLNDLKIEGESDAQIFEETKEAMHKLGMSPTDIEMTFKICSAILHIGNIEFKGELKDLASLKDGVFETALNYGAELLGVDQENLSNSILQRKLRDSVVKQHTVQEAIAARDALSKFVYEKLFDWLINKMNISMSQNAGVGKKKRRGQGHPRSLGVLDIFGFEIFPINSFEQLCINFCNEKLQNFFNLHVFKKEQEEYRKEKIDVAKIGFYDNEGVIKAIATDRNSVMNVCDDLCNLEQANDQTFFKRLINHAADQKGKPGTQQLSNKDFLYKPRIQEIRKKKHLQTAFVIKHFAGMVPYNVEGFIEKNKDQLRKDIRFLLSESKISLVKNLFPDGGDGNIGKQGKFRLTLSRKFQGSLKQLMTRLNNTTPQFVRCIKPNDEKKPQIFTAPKVYKQLNEAGLVEVCKIRKLGYPIKKSHKQFVNDYLCIDKSSKNVNDLCDNLMKKGILFKTNESPNWQVGITKVFLRSEQLYILEKERSEALKEVLKILHSFARKAVFRMKLRQALDAIRKINRGVETKDPEMLQQGLEYYESKGNEYAKLPIVLHGKEMMKELRVKLDVINDLKAALEAEDYGTVKVKLALAEELQMTNHAVYKEAKQKVELLVVRKEVNTQLQEALGSQEVSKLEKAIAYAQEKGYGTTKLCKQAEKMCKTLKERNSLLGLLRQELDKKDLDVDAIAKYITDLRNLGCPDNHELILEAAKRGDLMIEMKKQRETQIAQLEKQLKKNIKAGNYHRLKELVSAAIELQYNGELVKSASDMIQNLQQRQEFLDEVTNASRVLSEKSKLPAGIKESDLTPLRHSIKTAVDTPGLNLAVEIQVTDGEKLLIKMEEQLQVQDELELVLKEDSPTSFYKMLEKVQLLGLQTKNADILVQKVREMELVKAKVDAINNENLTNDIIKNLVSPDDGQRLKNLQNRIQLAYSSKFKDLLETVWNSKDLAMSNYYKVRSDADYVAKERQDDKEIRRKMKHAYEENKSLTKSLIEMNDLQEKKALLISSTITKLCDRVSNKKDTMESAMITITCYGISDQVLADEIYIQLAKHLTANPNPLSKTKGWHLLCLCSTFFAPSERFLKYFISFLHNTTSDVGLEGNYARYVTTQISASLEQNPRDINFKPTRKEVKAFFERPPVLMQLAVIDGSRQDVPVPPDFTLEQAAKIIRKRTKIMIDLKNPEWAIYLRATKKPPKLTWKTRLENFYRYYKPENLGNVDQILAYYKGHEESLFKELVETKNYGPEPNPTKTATMNQLKTSRKTRGLSRSRSKSRKESSAIDVDELLEDDEETKSQFSVSSKSSISSAISKVGSVVSKFFKRARGRATVDVEDIDIPNPKISWPLPWSFYIGDTVNALYEQDLIPVLTYKRRMCRDKGKVDENLFLQLKRDFLEGSLIPDAQAEIAYLSVIILSVKLKDKKKKVPFGEKNKLLKAGLLNTIPKTIKRANKKNEHWLDAFVEVAADQSVQLKEMSKRELQDAFFKKVKQLPGYGMSFFSAQVLKNNVKSYIAKAQTDESEGIVKVGINQYEISFFEDNEKKQTFPLENISKYFYDGTTITFKVRRGKKKQDGKNKKNRKSRKSLRLKLTNKMTLAVKGLVGMKTDTVMLYTLQPIEMSQLITFFKEFADKDNE